MPKRLRQRVVRRTAVLLACCLLCLCYTGRSQTAAVRAEVPAVSADPDAKCAACHQQIYEHYKRTPMAHASGEAKDGLLAGAFTHAPSGVQYKLSLQGGRAWLSYQRTSADPLRSLNGQQQLLYYIGSGKRGRTYLFEREGFWFESPVNWYTKKQVWDMAPSQIGVHEMPFTMLVSPDCLHCHASQVQESLPGSRNHYREQPFLQTGITCASCHGDASAHLAQNGKGPILNPAKLDAERRDSICLQCHLEGETAVARPGYSMNSFYAGDRLFDQAVFFARDKKSDGTARSTSQWEALLLSACKRKSGDRLTCTTCHDPHQSPAPEQRVAYFREKCLSCHGSPVFVAKHHPEQQDCASCHMPALTAENVAHEQVTDHRILRRPTLLLDNFHALTPAASNEPRPIGGVPAGDREYGLADAQLATAGNPSLIGSAIHRLQAAERSDPRQSADATLHTELGFMEQLHGDRKAADLHYRTALHADPADSAAAGDLALLLAQSGDFATAARLWQTVFTNDPTQLTAGLNLAIAECTLGDTKAAESTLGRLLAFSPDDTKARQLRQAIALKPCVGR